MNYIIVSSSFPPKCTANGICVNEVIKKLDDNDYFFIVTYDAFGNKRTLKENMEFRTIPSDLLLKYKYSGKNNKLLKEIIIFITRLKSLFLIVLYPLNSIKSVYLFYCEINKIIKKNNIDGIISTYRPLEGCVASYFIKKKYPNIKTILYVLDTLVMQTKKNKIINYWANKSGWIWENRFYKVYDRVINLENYALNYENKRYEKFKAKIYFSGIPLFVLNKKKKNNDININKQKMLYAGSLNIESRNPEYLCKIFTNAKFLKNMELDFFTKSCVDVIMKFTEKSINKIALKGYVSREQMKIELDRAYILISIGNQNSKMVPSKIFEYISTKKKIIHFFKDNTDSCLYYLKKYKNALLINENDDFDENIEKINYFIKRQDIEISDKELEESFYMNTPVYTANIIKDLVEVKK